MYLIILLGVRTLVHGDDGGSGGGGTQRKSSGNVCVGSLAAIYMCIYISNNFL